MNTSALEQVVHSTKNLHIALSPLLLMKQGASI